MKKRQIDNDRFIVSYNNKYYVVNEYTYNLLEIYKKTNNLEELSKLLNVNKRETKKIYKKLLKEIESIDYYEDNISLDFPLKVQWKITNRCNLKCKHCYLGKLDQKELTSNELLNIANKIVDSNIMEVTITGGEALLVKELPKIISLFIRNDIKVNIFTNGLLLNSFEEELYKELKYHPIDSLNYHISIDGCEKTHDEIRGKGNYKKTLNNLKKLIDLNYKVTTNTVLSTINYEDIPILYKELYNIGVNRIQISNLIPEGNATDKMQLKKEQKEKFIIELKRVLDELDNGSKLLYAEMPDEGELESKVFLITKNGKTYLEHEKWKCSAGIGKATINYDGEVYCCPFIKKYPLGNISKKSFKELWTNKNRYEFLELIAKENNNSRICIAMKSKQKER